MTPPGPDLKAIFSDALDLPPGPDRSAFLDRACGSDAALRLRVETLLNAHEQAGGFLGSSPDGPVTADHTPEPVRDATAPYRPIAEGPGTVIGPYKLLQKIGEGGMGAVFMAEQERPVRRKVALKVIKPGLDTAQVIARFEAERQALAMMDHPNIARVLDVGATDSGRPFFVMELVKGVPVTEYCDRNHLTPKERLELFIPVCRAIQHAHQKGIIHRDIKPSNVLVTLHDGQPVPKVIDFGVAKAVDQRLTEKTMFTEFGAVIGTLEYMSPEQAEMGALDVDTRSDIYSLGVVLYELLTGSTPLERAKLRQAAYSEIIRRIREEEPTKPSTRLSESRDALPSISAQRKTDPARLTKLVRGDLDWIVMKALEKDRTRRYETATGFAKDIQRYLDGDAVEACPPSAAYRLRKFARRHRAGLATAGAFALLLVAATADSVWLALRADRERVRAVRAETLAKEQKGRAQERERLAIDAVKRYGEVVRETPALKNDPGLAGLRATLLKEPQAFFQRLRDRLQADKETTPESLSRLASASYELGNLANEIGDKQDALRAYEESLAIRERLAGANPSVVGFQSDLAASHDGIGLVQRATGRTAEALASHERARAIWERLARADPSVTAFQRDLASGYNDIGLLQRVTGRPAAALASFEQARAIRERLVRENPSDTQLQSHLAGSHNNTGTLQRETGRPAEALASHERAVAILERLARENPSVTEFQRNLAVSHSSIAMLRHESGRPAEELASLERAVAILDRLARENPSVTEFHRSLASVHNNIGALQGESGRPTESLASLERARAIWERLARENPSVTTLQGDLATCHSSIGHMQGDSGRPAEALASLERARAIFERLAREHPESPEFASGLGVTLNNMAMVELRARRFDAARADLKQAVEWQRKALATGPRNPTYRKALVTHLGNLVRAAEGLGRPAEADEARRELAELESDDPEKAALDERLAAVLKGGQEPRDEGERIQLALRAYARLLYAASARLFAEALAKTPGLADDRQAQHAYNAACAAALAGSGKSKDDPPPDDAAKANLRRQAREWLQAELAAWARVLDAGPAELQATVAPTLQHWKADADLAGVRDEKELARLPEEEQAAFKQLWTDVDELLAKSATGK